MAATLLTIATLEAGFGLGSLAFYKLGLIPRRNAGPAKQMGPALPMAPASAGQAIASSGGDVRVMSSEGWRGPERSAEELKSRIVVALFGGSSTFDGQNRDGEAWSDPSAGDTWAHATPS